jgi:FkbM family methyltransferase
LKGLVFWDIGAHYGIHTVGMAMQVGPSGQVAAFEPDPAAFDRLFLHVSKNHLENVRLFRAAASDSNGQAPLFFPAGARGSSNSFLRYHDSDNMMGTPQVSVETLSLDTLVDAGTIRPPSVIKVDCQGHGGKALRGAVRAITAALPIICYSNHSDEELSTTRTTLEAIGYMPYSLDRSPLSWDRVSSSPVLLRTALQP